MSAGLGCRCYEECRTEAYHREASWFVLFFFSLPIRSHEHPSHSILWIFSISFLTFQDRGGEEQRNGSETVYHAFFCAHFGRLKCFLIVRYPTSHFGILPPLIELELTGTIFSFGIAVAQCRVRVNTLRTRDV